ncbi:MAG: hypothetical protein RIQ46_987 [Pseudomonadota bacterium]|jgi:uncharacterized membrane protein YhhN
MPKRALMEKRPWLLASLAAALAWYGLQGGEYPEPYLIALKGAGVGLLAIWAVLRHAGADSRMLAAVMALGALGDMAIERWLEAGAAFFLAGHLVAIALYLRHRRERLSPSQKLAALTLLVMTPLISFLLTASPLVAVYALGLGAMAATAWSSGFNRYRVGLGAVLFVASDLLIFARMGPLAASPLPGLLIWPLYYCGQLLICTGVIATLGRRAG